jgi:hypothetical protein
MDILKHASYGLKFLYTSGFLLLTTSTAFALTENWQYTISVADRNLANEAEQLYSQSRSFSIDRVFVASEELSQFPGDLLPPLELFPSTNADSAVTTNIDDTYPIVTWLDAVDEESLPLQVPSTLDLAPGYYRADLQSYCLHAGTYAPTQGAGYLLAPLAGSQAELIQSILDRSVGYPDIDQRDIQRLIWGIEAGVNFLDYPTDFIARVQPLLTQEDIASLSIQNSNIVEGLLGGLIPGEVQNVIETYERMRQLLTDFQTSYEQIESVAVLTGSPPIGENSRTIDAGVWNYAGDQFYIRAYPHGYPQITVEILRPASYRLERDEKGRIVVFESGDYRIETIYDDSPSQDSLAEIGHPDAYIWTIAELKFIGPGEDESFVLDNPGWIVASEDVAYPGDSIVNTETLEDMALKQFSDEQLSRWQDYQNRVNKAKGHWDKIQKFRQDWTRSNRPPGEEAIRDITDLNHYKDGLKAAQKIGDLEGKGEWIRNHLSRVTNAWLYSSCVLSGHCPPPGETFEAEKSPNPADRLREFDPAGKVEVPANTSQQRLGLSGRFIE